VLLFISQQVGSVAQVRREHILVAKVVERPNPKDRVHKPRESFPMAVVPSAR
jgi:hypothetical protein